jgi:hypothetical protein
MTTERAPVKHQDVIRYILAMVEVRKLSGQPFIMEHLKNNRDNPPFHAANALAQAGKWRSEIPAWDLDLLRKDQEQMLVSLRGINIAVSQALFTKWRISNRKRTGCDIERRGSREGAPRGVVSVGPSTEVIGSGARSEYL